MAPRLDHALLDITPETDLGASSQPNPSGTACQMATLSFKTALGTKLAFTGLVFAVSLAAAATLIYAIIKSAKDGADLSTLVTGVSGIVASGGALFLVKRMNEAGAAERAALKKVYDFCGASVGDQLKR